MNTGDTKKTLVLSSDCNGEQENLSCENEIKYIHELQKKKKKKKAAFD